MDFIEEAMRIDWSNSSRNVRRDIMEALGKVNGFRLDGQMAWSKASPAIRHGLKCANSLKLAKWAKGALVGSRVQVTLDFYRAIDRPHCSVPEDLAIEQGVPPTVEQFTTAWKNATPADRPSVLLCIAVVAEVGLQEWRAAACQAHANIESMARDANVAPADVEQHPDTATPSEVESPQGTQEVSADEPPAKVDPRPRKVHALSELDNVFIDLVIATTDGIYGAKSIEQLQIIIDEFTRLNSNRFQSRFHRGYLAGMMQSDFPNRTAGENDGRRAWLLAGWLSARLRQVGNDVYVEFQKLSVDDQRTLFSDPGRPATKSIADAMVVGLAASGQAGAIPRWLSYASPVGLKAALAHARLLLRERRPQEAEALAVAVRDAHQGSIATAGHEIGSVFIQAIVVASTASRILGHFDAAITTLRAITSVENAALTAGSLKGAPPELMMAFSDARAQALLCKAHIQDVERLWLHRNPSDRELQDKLNPISIELLLHMRAPNVRASGTLTYCTALWIVSSPSRPEAKAAKEECIKALSDIIADIQSDATPRLTQALFPRMVVLRALLVISLGKSQTDESIKDLVEYERNNEPLPFHIVRDPIEFGLAADVQRTVELISPRVENDLDNLLKSNLLVAAVQHPSISALIYERFADLTGYISRIAAIRVGAEVFKASIGAGGKPERMDDLVDEMIGIVEGYNAASVVCLDAFLERDGWAYIWSEKEFVGIRARLAECSGSEVHQNSTRQWLLQKANSLAAQDAHLAEECIQFAEWLGMPPETCDGVRKKIAKFCGHPPNGTVAANASANHARVLFVGGDQRQKIMQPAIRRVVSASHPNVTIEFVHPGWSSNWKAAADSVSRKLEDVDVVVLNPFVRTMFGRHVRKTISDAEMQWRTTYGHATPSIARAIVVAADVVGAAGL
jgi:hypothetical protein